MNTLWITYAPIGRTSELLHGKRNQGGYWVDASAQHVLEQTENISITILAIGDMNKELTDPESGVKYVEYSGVKKTRGKRIDGDVEKWMDILKKYPCELIELFGTEFANGLDIIEAANRMNIPVVIFIQGLTCSFLGHELGHMSYRELRKGCSFLNRVKALRYRKDYLNYVTQSPFESEMIKKCCGVIVDNKWVVRAMGLPETDGKVFRQILPVSTVFLSGKWDIKSIDHHSIFTVAGRTPYKGLHILLKALLIVKESFPDVRLYVPGNMDSSSTLRQPPYIDYISRFIKKNGLEENITFLGQLESKGMKEKILKCNAYVMPSCIENHSSSLREAMYLGAPCISAEVGSITETTINGKNALTYRYEEHMQLAMEIIEIFRSDDLAISLGSNAYADIRDKYPQEIIGQQLVDIYHSILTRQ